MVVLYEVDTRLLLHEVVVRPVVLVTALDCLLHEGRRTERLCTLAETNSPCNLG